MLTGAPNGSSVPFINHLTLKGELLTKNSVVGRLTGFAGYLLNGVGTQLGDRFPA